MEDNSLEKLQRSYHKNRIALFMTYGLEGGHLDRAIAFLKKRKYMVNGWAMSDLSNKTLEKNDSKLLVVKRPPKINDGWVPPLPQLVKGI